MSDNGACFTGRFLNGTDVDFERHLRALGIRHILSSPGHPQTCAKLERCHTTEKQWLARQPRARSLRGLQDQLDCFAVFYNEQRPHHALHGATPFERWTASEHAVPGAPIPAPPTAELRVVDNKGRVAFQGHQIAVGAHHAGEQLLVIARDDHVTIFGPDRIIRRLNVDRTHRYQPSPRHTGPCS
jgi:hypothetical protein